MILPFAPRKFGGGGDIAVFHTLRGVAALLVVVVHTFPVQLLSPTRQPAMHQLMDFGGAFAVCCFFLLSGFLVSLSMEREASAVRFLWRRAVRLMPVYWACLALATAAFLLQRFFLAEPGLVAAFGPLDASQLFRNAFLVHDVYGSRPVIPPVWTLLVEWKFYFLLAGLKLARQDLRSARTVVIATCLPLFFAMTPYESIKPYVPGIFSWQILTFKDSGVHVAFMFLGVAWARWHTSLWSLRKFLTTSAAIIAVVLMMADDLVCRYNDSGWAWRYIPAYAAAMATFAALQAIGHRNLLGGFGLFLGNCSYPLYCLHVPLINLVLVVNAVRFHLNVWAATLVTDLAIVCLAYAVHRCVEAPTVQWSRRLHRSAPATIPSSTSTLQEAWSARKAAA